MPLKISLLEIEKTLLNFPYKFLSGNIKNSNSKLEFLCEKHGVFLSSLKKIRHGYKCQRCSAEKRALKTIASIEDLKERLLKKFNNNISYIDGYAGKSKKTNFFCKIHGNFISNFDSILRKSATAGCPNCAKDKRGKALTSIEKIKSLVNSNKYEIMNTSYDSHKSKIEIKCKEHNYISRLSLDKVKIGKRCKFCSYEKQGKTKRLSIEDARKKIEKTEYYTLSIE